MPGERIDKLIAGNGTRSRKEAAKLIATGEVRVNGEPVRSPSQKINMQTDEIFISGELLCLKKHIYLMLNKPKGVVSVSSSKADKTVVDLVPPHFQRSGLFPAGRLDKDTTGFVLITDDGAFAHDILSPKKHIDKMYLVTLARPLAQTDIEILENGLQLKDGTVFLPSKIKLISGNSCEITIREGKYHQIKRMFKAVGNEVVELHRFQMGRLALDEALPQGACRELTEAEILKIRQRDEK